MSTLLVYRSIPAAHSVRIGHPTYFPEYNPTLLHVGLQRRKSLTTSGYIVGEVISCRKVVSCCRIQLLSLLHYCSELPLRVEAHYSTILLFAEVLFRRCRADSTSNAVVYSRTQEQHALQVWNARLLRVHQLRDVGANVDSCNSLKFSLLKHYSVCSAFN